MSKHKIKRILQNLILFSISILVAISIVEISVRLFFPDLHITHNWEYNSVLGWSQIPNAKYDFKWNGKDSVHIEFNSLGFRDCEHTVKKPAGTKRIAIIGDSFCESVQVNLNETFFKQLELLLNKKEKGQKWQVLNFGVGDFGTAQEWIALNKYALKYSPDIVIQEIFPLNDICNNTLDLFGLCRSYNDRYRPYFVETPQGLKLTSAQPVRNFLRRHFVSYNIAERAFLNYFGLFKRFANDKYRNKMIKDQHLPPLDPLLYTYVQDDKQIKQIQKGWHLTEEIIKKIVRKCQQKGVAYVGVVAPFEARLNPLWKSFARNQPPPAMIQYYPEQRLSKLFKRLGVPSVMLIKTLQKHENIVIPYRDGHLNPNGHRLSAEYIFEKLKSAHLIK